MGGTLGHRGAIGRLLLVVPLLVAALAFGSARPAEAANTNCIGEVYGGTIKGNVVVPAGGQCNLNGVTVTGSVTAQQGASLQIYGGSDIRGGLAASGAYYIYMNESTVRGSVSISSTRYVALYASEFVGNVTVSQSGATGPNPAAGGYVDIDDNAFRVSVVLSKNGFGGAYFSGNSVKINLVCDGNTDASISGNDVGGQVVGDCPGAEGGGDI